MLNRLDTRLGSKKFLFGAHLRSDLTRLNQDLAQNQREIGTNSIKRERKLCVPSL